MLAKRYMRQQDLDNCTASDYAVIVEGLPRSGVRKDDVIDFFSSRFAPENVEGAPWRARGR